MKSLYSYIRESLVDYEKRLIEIILNNPQTKISKNNARSKYRKETYYTLSTANKYSKGKNELFIDPRSKGRGITSKYEEGKGFSSIYNVTYVKGYSEYVTVTIDPFFSNNDNYTPNPERYYKTNFSDFSKENQDKIVKYFENDFVLNE